MRRPQPSPAREDRPLKPPPSQDSGLQPPLSERQRGWSVPHPRFRKAGDAVLIATEGPAGHPGRDGPLATVALQEAGVRTAKPRSLRAQGCRAQVQLISICTAFFVSLTAVGPTCRGELFGFWVWTLTPVLGRTSTSIRRIQVFTPSSFLPAHTS